MIQSNFEFVARTKACKVSDQAILKFGAQFKIHLLNGNETISNDIDVPNFGGVDWRRSTEL